MSNHPTTRAAATAIALITAMAPALADQPLTPAFSAFPTWNQVGIPSESYTRIWMDGVEFDTTGDYIAPNSMWCPSIKTQKVGHIEGQIWIIGGVDVNGTGGGNPSLVAKVERNKQDDVFTGIGTPNPAMPGTATIQFHKTILVRPGDCYWLTIWAGAADYQTTYNAIIEADTVYLDRNKLHIFWSGFIVP